MQVAEMSNPVVQDVSQVTSVEVLQGIIGGRLPERKCFMRKPLAKAVMIKPHAKAKHRRTKFDKSPAERRLMKVMRSEGGFNEETARKTSNRVKNEIIADHIRCNNPFPLALVNAHTDMAVLKEHGYDIEVSAKITYLCNEVNSHLIRRLRQGA